MNVDILNDVEQPVGKLVPNWQPIVSPFGDVLIGQYCRVQKLVPALHGSALYQAYSPDTEGRVWTYLAYGSFASAQAFLAWLQTFCMQNDPFFYVIETAAGPLGLASYMRIDRQNGSVEIGNLAFSPSLQRTRVATEALYLMMHHAFSMGFRRVEWKCNALNAPSVAAALRLGMRYEGTFRQAAVIKGRNRDTAWYSLLDSEWRIVQPAYQQWLSSANFDAEGQQKERLQTFLQAVIGRS